ncbi:unnamed protein product [Somion occarium]|uniref:Uncharacterized protein n=1 Tax=Somion occarium TaxID=3059160 RepID=A0ABP1E3N5_9APHY
MFFTSPYADSEDLVTDQSPYAKLYPSDRNIKLTAPKLFSVTRFVHERLVIGCAGTFGSPQNRPATYVYEIFRISFQAGPTEEAISRSHDNRLLGGLQPGEKHVSLATCLCVSSLHFSIPHRLGLHFSRFGDCASGRRDHLALWCSVGVCAIRTSEHGNSTASAHNTMWRLWIRDTNFA